MAVRLTAEFFVCDFNLSRELENARSKINYVIAAKHADHILRASAQGDDLPVRGYAEAQRHLKTMLLKRMAQLARTDAELDTSRREVDH